MSLPDWNDLSRPCGRAALRRPVPWAYAGVSASGWAIVFMLIVVGGCDRSSQTTLPEPAARASDRVETASPAPPRDATPLPPHGGSPNGSAPNGSAPNGSAAVGGGADDRVVPPTGFAASHPIDRTVEGQLYRRAVAALDAGEPDVAEQIRVRLADHPQFSILADAIGAFQLVRAGEPESALEQATAISRVPVMQAESYVIAAEAFRVQGRLADAIAALQEATGQHPSHLRAHRWLGAIYFDTGAMRAAVTHLRKVADLDPRDYRSLRLAGLIHRDYQQFDQAIDDYRAALRRSPAEPMASEIRLELADALREQREIGEAIRVLEECRPSADVQAVLAACHEAAGDDDAALRATEATLADQPGHAQGNLIRGRILAARRDWGAAISHLRVAVEAEPSDHEPRFLLGRALLQSGNREEGEAEIRRSTELKEWKLELAELHLQAIDRPEDAQIRMRMGLLAERMGRPQTALGWYRAAAGLDPELEAAGEAISRLRSTSAATP